MKKHPKKKKYYKKRNESRKYSKEEPVGRAKALQSLISKIKVKIIDNPIEDSVEIYIKKSKGLAERKDLTGNYQKEHKDFIERILLNNIRHNYSNYMKLLSTNLLINDDERAKFKEATNEIIKKKYKEYI